MKTKGALIWDFHRPWSVEEIDIGDPRKGEVNVALEGRNIRGIIRFTEADR